MNSRTLALPTSVLVLVFSAISLTSQAKSKYGPDKLPIAVSLSESNEYFRDPKHKAPQFWSLISFYDRQDPGTCSVTSATMVLNAALARLPRTTEDKVITTPMLSAKIKSEKWIEKALTDLKQKSYIASLDQFGLVLGEIFKSSGFPKATVEVVHVKEKNSLTRQNLIKVLNQFSESKNHYLIANFNQKHFTDDYEVGHYAPIGAFDPKTERVLVLDPDREYYEPYWVKLDTFLEGMNTLDSGANQHRGYFWITVAP